jgi:LysM repeat protein
MKVLSAGLSLFIGFALQAETRFTTQDYIDQFKIPAVEQMNSHKIPASITLAQGILESGNGNSKLAREAKNHFGIKCHSTWTGDTFFQDDDKKNECFRSYNSVSDSYNDHSLFLKRKRYAGLFELKMTDYKGWAKGLKSAGYATNPKYANLLIDLIEKYNLDKFDKMPDLANQIEQEESLSASQSNSNVEIKPEIENEKPQSSSSEITYNISEVTHKKNINKNNVTYIVAKEGDTFLRISREFDLAIGQLYNYNEFYKKDVLKEGDIIYIVPKKNRAKKGNATYVCEKNMSIRDVAHLQGVKLKKIMKLNGITNSNEKLPKGKKVILR